jgi:hypothetical protein
MYKLLKMGEDDYELVHTFLTSKSIFITNAVTFCYSF